MKRFLSVLIIVTFLILLSGCDKTSDVGSDGKLSVVTTIFAPFDFTREIASDYINLTMLIPAASEIHSFEPTARDIINIQNCDIFIYVGGESDSWVEKILSSVKMEDIQIITLMDCVETLEEEIIEGMEEDEEDSVEIIYDEQVVVYDEHIWTSPKNAQLIVKKINNVLCELDEENASAYQNNTNIYLDKLVKLDAAFREITEKAERKTIIFGDRFPFRYLADAYNLEYFAAFPGCSSETEPSAATVAFLIDKVKEKKIPVIFHVELSNKKMAEAISEETGAKVLLLHACHNISKNDFENGVSYLDLMTANVEALREALN